MKISQFFRVVLVSLIVNVGFAQKLPAQAFVINNTEDSSSLTTDNSNSGGSNLSQFLTPTSQSNQNLSADCNLIDKVASKDVLEPTLITGLVFVAGLGLWKGKKRFIRNDR
ncbi:MAG: hypothetical protein F6K17_02300 [Okeania sp. SIO3C4]|nr:hypothetical protein [Okeania sp. SIO3C4]